MSFMCDHDDDDASVADRRVQSEDADADALVLELAFLRPPPRRHDCDDDDDDCDGIFPHRLSFLFHLLSRDVVRTIFSLFSASS